jgi:hypothetical protein
MTTTQPEPERIQLDDPERIQLDDLVRKGLTGSRRDISRSAYRDRVGANLAYVVLGAIGVTLAAVFVHAWVTEPTIRDVLPAGVTDKAGVEEYERVIAAHQMRAFEEARNYVAAILVPLFTLIVGYIFGSHIPEETAPDND